MMEWQPIDTAPTDGSKVLIYWHGNNTPTCPHCDHAMTFDEMLECKEHDLFAFAPREACEEVTCPSCNKAYWLKGGYIPTYTSAVNLDDL